jgi:hypothetical protein
MLESAQRPRPQLATAKRQKNGASLHRNFESMTRGALNVNDEGPRAIRVIRASPERHLLSHSALVLRSFTVRLRNFSGCSIGRDNDNSRDTELRGGG